MQNKWTIYSFLGIMIAALITLAVLQYHWLGSVSDAEKKRLEENLEASTENFVSDLNKDFSALNQAFKIQVTNTDSDIDAMIGRSYLSGYQIQSIHSSSTLYISCKIHTQIARLLNYFRQIRFV